MCDICEQERAERKAKAVQSQCLTFYEGIIDDLQRKIEVLATAILTAHKGNGHCNECSHAESGEVYRICKGGEFDCCKCSVCTLARGIRKHKIGIG